MKTTLILDDHLVRRAKSHAALRGLTLSRYMEKCLELGLTGMREQRVGDWLHTLPATPAAAAKEVNALLESADFEVVDPEMWQ